MTKELQETNSSQQDEVKMYRHYAAYLFMNRTRGIVRIDGYDSSTGNAAVTIVYGEPDREEVSEKVTAVMNSGELLTSSQEFSSIMNIDNDIPIKNKRKRKSPKKYKSVFVSE